MNQPAVLRAAALAAAVALVCTLFMGFVFRAPDAGYTLQPSSPASPLERFVHPTNTYPDLALRFFATDTLFVLSYLMVFVGLYAATAANARPFAVLGLSAGILAALFDAVENAFFIVYAVLAKQGVPLTDPALPLIFVVANLKWMAAFATLYAFGLAMPRRGVLEWVLTVLMLLFPLAGALGVADPSLEAVRGLFFFAGMPLFAVYFLRRAGT